MLGLIMNIINYYNKRFAFHSAKDSTSLTVL